MTHPQINGSEPSVSLPGTLKHQLSSRDWFLHAPMALNTTEIHM